jgi:hypothetical protein
MPPSASSRRSMRSELLPHLPRSQPLALLRTTVLPPQDKGCFAVIRARPSQDRITCQPSFLIDDDASADDLRSGSLTRICYMCCSRWLQRAHHAQANGQVRRTPHATRDAPASRYQSGSHLTISRLLDANAVLTDHASILQSVGRSKSRSSGRTVKTSSWWINASCTGATA